MWDIVWVSPQGHRSVSVSLRFLLQPPQCPCSMRKRFSRDHCCWGRSKPGCRIVRSHTRWVLTTWADFQLCLRDPSTFDVNCSYQSYGTVTTSFVVGEDGDRGISTITVTFAETSYTCGWSEGRREERWSWVKSGRCVLRSDLIWVRAGWQCAVWCRRCAVVVMLALRRSTTIQCTALVVSWLHDVDCTWRSRLSKSLPQHCS